ncbi:MAG: peptidoglycan DD-metalloendopeptidase family protein [Deltaproteobacteria bacterium]|jgi:murein DD-endopeptidase MepM/ murein hydrolase activator NlpD|nr:peptidoglycan DD-metalloendopeptidase family protein [Deltaproteobacteria bacterium]
MTSRAPVLFAMLALSACESANYRGRDRDNDTDIESDTDIENDTDIESDTHTPSDTDSGPIPAGHPCPELAYPPSTPSLWAGVDRAPVALRIPLPPGATAPITQGNDGAFTHVGRERYAWDFGVPIDTPVHAAAGGVVVWVEDTHTEWGPGDEHLNDANYIVIDHGGALFSSYVHLGAGTAEVRPGDVVAPGERIAHTGLSGQMTGPHLHFHVENAWSESLPAAFATEHDGCTLVPQEGQLVTAQPFPLVDLDRVSEMPADAFAEDGVVDLHGLPARLFEREEHLTIDGRTTLANATEVYLLVLPAQGGRALLARRFNVANAHFTGRFDLDEIAAGQYGIALVAGRGGGVSVPRSVRAALVR